MAENLPSRGARPSGRRDLPTPPDHLSAEVVELLWTPILNGWSIGPDGLPLLLAACQEWDTYMAAAAKVRAEGSTTVNPDSGVIRQHPAAAVARDSLREFRQLYRQLALDPEVP